MPILLESFARQIWKGDPEVALPGSGLAMPNSLRATLTFNGITINDLYTVDRIVVTEVDGFHSPDVRSSSIPNPGSHGETPLDNYLGGKTMLIRGYIQAHNSERLEDLTQALANAFYSMVEKPLIVSIADIERDVQIRARIVDKIQFSDQFGDFQFKRNFQITMRATDPRWLSLLQRRYSVSFGFYDRFTLADPLANWTVTSEDEPDAETGAIGGSTDGDVDMLLDAITYRPTDSRITAKVTTGAAVNDKTFVEITPKFIGADNMLRIRFTTDGSDSTIAIYKMVGGEATKLAESAKFTPVAETEYWLSYVQEGNLVGATLYADDDPYDDVATVVETASHTLTSNDILQFGDGLPGRVGFKFGEDTAITLNDYRVEPLALDHDILSAVNVGNWMASARIRLYGPMKNVILTNKTPMRDEATPRFLKINGEIPAGTYYEYDADEGSLVDASGVDHFAQVDVSSKPLLIEGLLDGPNIISMKAEGMSTIDPRVDLLFHNTWS